VQTQKIVNFVKIEEGGLWSGYRRLLRGKEGEVLRIDVNLSLKPRFLS